MMPSSEVELDEEGPIAEPSSQTAKMPSEVVVPRSPSGESGGARTPVPPVVVGDVVTTPTGKTPARINAKRKPDKSKIFRIRTSKFFYLKLNYLTY